MQPKGVIFDFDGVVVDSMAMHLNAWQGATRQLFNKEIDPKLFATLAGRSTATIARLIAQDFGRIDLADHLADSKRNFLAQNAAPPPLLPGARASFELLKRSGVPHGIASNAPRQFIVQTLNQHGLNVGVVLGIEDATRPKPAPDPYLQCAKQLGILPGDHARTIVFEDSTHGLKAAIDAGMIGIGVTTTHDAETLTDAGARYTCENLEEAISKNWMLELD